jgi:hypothetical protein
MPLTALGAWVGRHIAKRLDDNAATILALGVLGAAGLYTLAAALHAALW